jgi:hypothetical protein
MADNTQDNQNSQSDPDQHIKNMLGPFPRDPQKPKEDKPQENMLVIEGDHHAHLQPAHTAGSVITPSQKTEQKLPESTHEQRLEPDEEQHSHDVSDDKSHQPTTENTKKPGKIKRFFKAWWGNPKLRWATICILVAAVLAIIVIPTTRYFVLNTVGVRSSASVTVLDNSTQLPLKNVKVSIAGVSGQTDDEGKVKLTSIKLGNTKLVIEKRAFAKHDQPITIGWGSNPLGQVAIKAVGVQYAFTVTDWLSNKPIEGAEATSGESNALSDEKGKILLTIDPSDVSDNLTVTISADDYRSEKSTPGSTDNTAVQLVAARKEVFVSNRSGKYDLYKIDVDGKNEELVLAGTGLERDNITLVPHSTEEKAALVSSRVNVRNNDGYILDTLTLVDIEEKTTINVAQSENIQIIGWAGQRLVYVQIAAGASASNANRYRLISYDIKNGSKKELAKANAFNDVILIGNNVYYAPYGGYDSDVVGVYKVSTDGTGRQTLLSKEVWNIYRSKYDTLDLSLNQEWYQYKLGDSNAVKLNQAPTNPKSRVYIVSPDGASNLWIEQRDGKGVLLNYTQTSNKDTVLHTQSGLVYPVRWLSDSIFIYRVSTQTETADYVMSKNGGAAHKIKDVYNTTGIDRWYYY